MAELKISSTSMLRGNITERNRIKKAIEDGKITTSDLTNFYKSEAKYLYNKIFGRYDPKMVGKVVIYHQVVDQFIKTDYENKLFNALKNSGWVEKTSIDSRQSAYSYNTRPPAKQTETEKKARSKVIKALPSIKRLNR